MLRILMYVGIILFGFLLSSKNLIPEKINKKVALCQTCALFFLLGIMGYKIGVDDQIISKLPTLGYQAFVIASFSCIGSILVTKLFFYRSRKTVATEKKKVSKEW